MVLACLVSTGTGFLYAHAPGPESEIDPPPVNLSAAPDSTTDTITGIYPVSEGIPQSYDMLLGRDLPVDLDNPQNIRTEIEYDAESGYYVVRSRIGNQEVATPFMLTPEQYERWQNRKLMRSYYARRNSEHLFPSEKTTLNTGDMNFALGRLERIFGPGGVSLRTQGNVQINAGIKSNFTDNPALSLSSRRHTYFDFDQKIQANIQASVGNRLTFNMNYNTDATFDFDSKNLKLKYEGTEDDIVKSIEAGNVSMTTGSSLIRGSTALFGIKSTLQFGRLTATALVSQQNSESRSISTQRGAQTTDFSITADQYDANRHFFLAQFFESGYDTFTSRLPLVSSGIQITRIEVWITNKQSDYGQSRNIVAFADLGENRVLANDYWHTDPSVPVPSNTSNNLISVIKTDYPDARNINTVTQALEPLQAFGIYGGSDFEKVESARLLSETEYTLNQALGYISLRSELRSDEVLGVAFEYTYMGKVYQVGEFSSDITATDQSLYVKMLKSTTQNPHMPMWRLMMKNIYNLGATQLQASNFRLNIKYLSDTTGTEINYLPIASMSDKPLLQVMNLDRLNTNNESNPDGFFDFIENYTVNQQTGRIIFPVTEPFGRHLEKAIGDPAVAEQYTFKELYDSTLTVARQYAEKNKFVMTGSYQASNGSQIRLNAFNVPRGSVIVTAGGVQLTENADYTVDYAAGIVNIINNSIIESGQSISVTLEDQSLFSTQRKSLFGLDLNYKWSKELSIGATILHYGEKALIEKVNIGEEVVNNTMLGLNFAYNKEFMWLTNLINKIPTVNATAPSRVSLTGEIATLRPQSEKSGSTKGSSYIDDFENAQSRFDLRSPYGWFLASTPYDPSAEALFPEAALSNNIDYGKNRALINWYYIDRLFTSRNSSLVPGYIKSDLKQLSNPYVREVTSKEIFPRRELTYGESSTIQTLNLSFYPDERGPYNLDAQNIGEDGRLLMPERRWGGIMRKMDNPNFEQQNIEYIQFWLLNPFLDPDNPNYEGGDLYFNLGEISEDILKDGMKSYENGVPVDGNDQYMKNTVWGRVSTQNSLTYAFDNNNSARLVQDTGLDGLLNDDEFRFPSYENYLKELRQRLPASTQQQMETDKFSPLNDPAGDNYHFYRGYDYDEQKLSILERYKRYNGVEGNSLSPEDAGERLYQSSRSLPDVEDINQDNTINEYERYFQYRVSIRPEDLVVGRNYITDKQTSIVYTRDGNTQETEWYQFKIPLSEFQKTVGSISDFSTIRFMRMFMTGFRQTTHLRFATLELVRGEWRTYDFNLNNRGDSPAEGQIDLSVVNIEENAGREPVNYLLPPGVSRISDPGQAQIVQENEQSLQIKVSDLHAGDARGVYRTTLLDLRNYKRLQMWIHAESTIDNITALTDGELSAFIRFGSDIKQNYYEYEIPLSLTPHGKYTDTPANREIVWPEQNFMNIELQRLVDLKMERNRAKRAGDEGVGYNIVYTGRDPENARNRMAVMGNPSISDIRVMLIGVRNNSPMSKDGVVWLNELKATEFNNSGGWAAKGNAFIAVSDVASVNVGAQMETAGFGGVDQSLNERRMDDFHRYDVAVQTDLGRFLPEGARLRAPLFFSMSSEKTSPKYNPLDRDVLLKDAIDAVDTKAERDSINAFAIDRSTTKNFSLSGLHFDVRSKNPMPWDPANFTAGFSFAKQSTTNPTTEYENTNDYRGSLQYSYAPYFRPLRPLSFIKSKSRHMKFLKEWELNWLPTVIGFTTNMSRFYYEQQTRSETDVNFRLPVSVNKNFLWDRQFNLSWNLTKSLMVSFTSNTSARIEEPVGAVNRKLFPDQYREWRDTVWQSILHMGTPWNYNQVATATYNAPFSRIPALDFLNATLSYNSTYRWDRGATVDGISMGNTVSNQTSGTIDGRINFDNLFRKSAFLKRVQSRFASSSPQRNTVRKPRRYERNVPLRDDTTVMIRHNLRSRRVRVRATDVSTGKPVAIRTRIVDNNNVEILNHGKETLKIVVSERLSNDNPLMEEIAQYAARLMMSPKNASVRIRSTRSLSLPLFVPDVGNIFGQSNSYGPMAPGLDFAFGFYNEDFISKAKERDWLITDDGQTSPASYSKTQEITLELNLEPIKGLKILLTTNRTDNHSNHVQFMYDNMPVSLSGSYTKTHIALGSALRRSSPDNGYESKAFNDMLANIGVINRRLEERYLATRYPDRGFMSGSPLAGQPFDPEVGTISQNSPDVLIPAFLAAYSGRNPSRQYLNPFPGLAHALPNWRVTYDGLTGLFGLKSVFKSFTLSHAYQCTYSVGSYGSYLNWVSADGSSDYGYILDELSGNPVPSSPYNISSVAITERFAPLIGCAVTLYNNMTINAEWRDQRTLTLNTSAGQIVEAAQRGITVGMGYKIANFNTVLKIKGQQTGVSHDLLINGDFSYTLTQALIRRIETAYTQPTSGTRNFHFNLKADYRMSRRLQIGAYLEHQVNTPVVSSSSYPTSSTAFGFSFNLSLAR